MSDGWAQRCVEATTTTLTPLADATRAPAMVAYMRDQFPFLGVATPQRRSALRLAWQGVAPPEGDEPLRAAVLALWALPQREYQYAACDLLARHRRQLRPAFLEGTLEQLVTTKSWWDTVDALQSAAIGPLVLRHRELVAVMHRWVEADDRWLVRSAIIHQLGYRDRADTELLLTLCARRASDREFFIAKAIGWALRDHAWRNPDAVQQFVDAHPELTALARREATKHLSGGGSAGPA